VPERDAAAALIADAGAFGVDLERGAAQRLLAFAALLERANRAVNLVSRRDVDRLGARHLLDSLSVAPLLPAGEVMDLGTGGGLPGVPLAIAREDVRFTLIDRSERKVRFVERAIRELGLDNATARCVDLAAGAAAAPVDGRGDVAAFDAVVSRAVAEPDRLWVLARERLRPGGVLVIMRHGQGGVAAAASPAAPPGARVVTERQIHIPGLPRPHGVVVLGRADPAAAGSAGAGE